MLNLVLETSENHQHVLQQNGGIRFHENYRILGPLILQLLDVFGVVSAYANDLHMISLASFYLRVLLTLVFFFADLSVDLFP